MNIIYWNASLVFVILGILLLVISYGLKFYLKQNEEFHGHTRAKVTDLVLRPNPDQNSAYRDCYFPIIEYYAGGKLYRQEYEIGSWPSTFQINDEISIDYDIADPNVWHISPKHIMSHVPYILNMVGRFLIIVSIGFMLLFTTGRNS